MAGQRRSRRSFLRQVTATSALLVSHRGLALAEVTPPAPAIGPPVGLGVVGLGPWGREILSALARLPGASVAAFCDTYAPLHAKALAIAPKAAAYADVRALLDDRAVEAVVVAIPTHRHKDVVLAALAAGKHVYCEAPLAASIEDARAIAQAALAARTVFQGGLQGRSNALYRHVAQFVKSGVLGTPVLAAAQWARKDSWRRIAPTPAREAELNWRLSSALSTGLAGEVGIHPLDLVIEYLGAVPVAVTGAGAIALWKDGRDVADTMQCAFDFPGGVRFTLEATLASSIGGASTLFRGSLSSLMVREKRAWLLKEADSPMLGWEVYARKENVLEETGIALVADSTKILSRGEEPGKVAAEPSRDPLVLAFEGFLASVRTGSPSTCGAREAYRATALALQASAAVRTGTRVPIPPEALEPA